MHQAQKEASMSRGRDKKKEEEKRKKQKEVAGGERGRRSEKCKKKNKDKGIKMAEPSTTNWKRVTSSSLFLPTVTSR